MKMQHVGFIFTGVFLALSSFAVAAPPVPGGSIAERYERARHALDESRADEAQTQAQRDKLAREAEDLRSRLIANAALVQNLETSLAGTESSLARLAVQMRSLNDGFARDRGKVAHLLAVLQRLDSDEPPALAMRSDDSLAAARGSMLLGAMLPPVYQQAVTLARRLHELRVTQASLERKRREARATETALGKARAALAALLDIRSSETTAAESRLADLHAVTEDVARETGDLKSLMDRIATLRAESDTGTMTVVTAENREPANLRKGDLRLPVIGRMLRGGPDAPAPEAAKGAEISGLWFISAGNAQAVAPADSEVVFSGPYQKFGQVLILEIAGGYDLLLAGLGRIDVHIGDSVLAGEPIGSLPKGTEARLYMELRRGGQTVNPAPWLAVADKKAKG